MTTKKSDRPEAERKSFGHDKKRALFLFNPVSGKSQIRTELADILVALSADPWLITCYPTRSRGDARNVTRTLGDEYECVFCAGGDGTLDEVVSGLMENPRRSPLPVGYIPAGTTNDFASSLGIPSDMKEAARAAVTGKPMLCDLGKFNEDTYFTYVAAFGLFTETSYETPQDMKNMLGHMAYVLQGMMDLGKMRTYRFRVESDEVSMTDDFVFGMITNSRSVGGFPDLTGSRVDLSDGLFEVTLIKMPANILELNDIVQYFNRMTDSSDLVYQFKTAHIVLESDEEVKWTRDGEFGGALRRVEVTNIHRSLKIIVPGQ